MRRNNLILGMFFVFLGIFFLLTNLNIINFSIWSAIFDLWPLFLVMLGIHLISKRPTVTVISWIVFFAIIIFYALAVENNSFNPELFNLKNFI